MKTKLNWIWIAATGLVVKANDIFDFIEKTHIKNITMHDILKVLSVIGEVGFWILLIYIAYQLFRFEKRLHNWNKLDPESLIISHRSNQLSTILLRAFLLSSVNEDDLVKKLYDGHKNGLGYTAIDLEIAGYPKSIINKLLIMEKKHLIEKLESESSNESKSNS